MAKRTAEKPKTATASPHPEAQRSAEKVPGAESSKVRHPEQDLRSKHDQDGNGQQRKP